MKENYEDRKTVARRLYEDLIGPREQDEILNARPTDVYVTGILWPRRNASSAEDDDRLGISGVGSEEGSSDAADTFAAGPQKPSVAGVSFSVRSDGTPHVVVECSFATYRVERIEQEDEGDDDMDEVGEKGNNSEDGEDSEMAARGKNGEEDADGEKRQEKRKHRKYKNVWIRMQHSVRVPNIDLSPGRMNSIRLADFVEEGVFPETSLNVRCVSAEEIVLVTLTLVNEAMPDRGRNQSEAATLFQTSIHVEPCKGTSLIPKPKRRMLRSTTAVKSKKADCMLPSDLENEEEVGEILYRDVSVFAVGHVCSADWDEADRVPGQPPSAKWIATTWLPSVIVDGVDPNGHKVFEDLGGGQSVEPLSAKWLSEAAPEALQSGLRIFCDAYADWIEIQRRRLYDTADVQPHLRQVGESQISRCDEALERMRTAVDELGADPKLRQAFQMANLAMDVQRSWTTPDQGQYGLRWRPFQLGFLLLSVPSALNRNHPHREVMDLLWFPTGGGKTEAYLALVACVAVHRRLVDDPDGRGGVCALMRYTLRLLTTQQFARSSAMIMALEAIRTGKVPSPDSFKMQGQRPFSIGLWIGGSATPNTRKQAFDALHGNPTGGPSPNQLERCPACGNKLKWSMQNAASPVQVECEYGSCDVRGPLPIFTIDEDVYENPPTLLIATADKFAQVVRRKQANALFGISTRTPPDLIIQDELHLISGPLGTVAGAYESAFDLMFSVCGPRPKVVGSTATIRRAPEQIRALFDRKAFLFPPSAIDHDDSGFAVLDRRPKAPGRRFIGVTSAGRSARFTLQAVAGSLLQSAFGAFEDDVRRDAYWTLVGYFNSLRDLGGALVLMQDDVIDSARQYAWARKEDPRPLGNIEELTSRRSQDEIRAMLDILDRKCGSSGAVDAVLATNMVSVGVDISRLGLMLVCGQPKTISEYIQSTSRVGRSEVGGLVVSVLGNAKVRDRFHFETFCGWHRTLYRDVEATSVTPFASRARDKTLHAVLTTAVRHLVADMLEYPCLDSRTASEVKHIIAKIVERAERVDQDEIEVRNDLEKKLNEWQIRAPKVYWNDYKADESLLQSAERVAADRAVGNAPWSAWKTLNSMRTVDTGTPFRMAPFLKDRNSSDGQ